MRASGIVWAVVALGAALMGLALISDEPGATAGRWYLGFAVAASVLTIGAFRARGSVHRTWVLLGSIVLLSAIAAHFVVVVAFAYSGLTFLLLVPASLAVMAAGIGWARNRSQDRPAA